MLIFWSAFSVAQNPIRFRNITVNDGLSMGTITAFQKDHKGYMWIGTAEGLHRYDGKFFKIFKHNENQRNTLTDSYITDLLSHDGTMYIGNNLGSIDLLDETTYKVKRIDFKKADSSFDNAIQQMVLYKNKIIIDTDGGGLWQYDPEQSTLRRVQILDLENKDVVQMHTEGNKLLLLTQKSLVSTDLYDSEIIHQTAQFSFSSVCKYKGEFWFGTHSRGLYRLDRLSNQLKQIKFPPKKRRIGYVNTLSTDGKTMWVGTEGGLLRIEEERVELYVADRLRPYSLVDNQVSNLWVDPSGILWVGTIAGVSAYAPQMNKFGLLQYFDYKDQNYNSNVYFTYEDRNQKVWLGTLTSGLIELAPDHTIENVYPVISSNGYESRSVRAIMEDSEGKFWLGTRNEGIFQLDRKTGKAKLIANRENGKLKSNVVRCIFEDSKGRIWIGSQAGLSLKNIDNNDFTHFSVDEKHKNNSIYQIEEDPKTGNLILASFRGGLQIFDIKSHKFKVYKHKSEDSTSLSNNNLMCMEWINDDTLLIGTYGGGLNIYDRLNESFTSITEADGLINNVVYGVLYEGSGKCWLSTNNGVVQYDIYAHSFTNYSPVHYLQSTEYNEGAFLKSSRGYFYFGGVAGLNYFKPQNIQPDTVQTSVFLTHISGNFTKQTKERVSLSFLDSRLELDFCALHYEHPEGVLYRYKLEGYDNHWIESGNSAKAIYPRLSPGSYTFEVEAKDEFGYWTANSNPLSVYVAPPFWQEWWFIALCVLLVGGIIYAIFRYRTHAIKRSYKLQLVDSELAALRSQMNPHFIFNSLNSIQYYILKKEPKEAYTYLSKFASLMRKILQNSRLRYISVTDEVEALNLYLEMEKMRMDNNLDFEVKTEGIEDAEQVFIPTMLIQPFVENSIVHGLLPKEDNRILTVHIEQMETKLVCTITDNGIGRDASRIMNAKRSSKHQSAGMALTEKRLEILSEGKGGFDLKIDDLHHGDGSKGTVVKLTVSTVKKTD